jgi:hypothetical protein
MKLGLIVEGYADGAVCRIAAQRLVPGLTVHEPTVMVNRPRLLDGCGDAAAALLKAGKCDKVAVVWDLYPNWADKQFKPCRKADRERVAGGRRVGGRPPRGARVHSTGTGDVAHRRCRSNQERPRAPVHRRGSPTEDQPTGKAGAARRSEGVARGHFRQGEGDQVHRPRACAGDHG